MGLSSAAPPGRAASLFTSLVIDEYYLISFPDGCDQSPAGYAFRRPGDGTAFNASSAAAR